MSIDVEIKTLVKTKSKSKTKYVKVSLLTSYHPTSAYKESDATNFNNQIARMLNEIPKSNILIMGADLNASIGTRTNDASNNKDPSVGLLGPHSNPGRNARG